MSYFGCLPCWFHALFFPLTSQCCSAPKTDSCFVRLAFFCCLTTNSVAHWVFLRFVKCTHHGTKCVGLNKKIITLSVGDVSPTKPIAKLEDPILESYAWKVAFKLKCISVLAITEFLGLASAITHTFHLDPKQRLNLTFHYIYTFGLEFKLEDHLKTHFEKYSPVILLEQIMFVMDRHFVLSHSSLKTILF